MSVFFVDPIDPKNEVYEYRINMVKLHDDDVIVSLAYETPSEYKIIHFAFTPIDFQKFYGFLKNIETSDEIILKDEINPIRSIVQDVYNEKVEDYQLIELLKIRKDERFPVIIEYRYLGQLIEREIAEKILTILLKNPTEEISELLDFLEYTEMKEMEIKFKNNLQFSNPLIKFNDETNSYEFDRREGIKKILGFEENVYTSETFTFRRYPRSITDHILIIEFTEEAFIKLREKIEEILTEIIS